jgi:signal transduction histidine kinase
MREQHRLEALMQSGLLEVDSIPVFEEATQTAAQFLQMPICWMGLMERDALWLRTTLGLSKLGLRNELATSRRLDRREAFCTHVVDSHQVFALTDASEHPAFARNLLTQQYGLRSYLGAPLLTANGYCVGTLAVLDVVPRDFTEHDVQILHMLARWCISEFERDRLLTHATSTQAAAPTSGSSTLRAAVQPPEAPPKLVSLPVRLQLVGKLVEKITSPLTAILGMAGMLSREIYGPLTDKQREYLTVILNSGQTLRSLAQEILELASLEDEAIELELTPVDIEMLCQKVIQSLEPIAKDYHLQLQLSIEPGQRLWYLDRVKVQQMLSHLIHGMIESAKTDGVLRIHVSRKRDHLRLALWLSNPLMDGSLLVMDSLQMALINEGYSGDHQGWPPTNGSAGVGVLTSRWSPTGLQPPLAGTEVQVDTPGERSATTLEPRPEHLRLLLSKHLAELHGGSLNIQNSPDAGCQYILSLPLKELQR